MNFSEKMIARTRSFAIETVLFCRKLKSFPETKTIQYQLIKSSTSVAANYRAACRARSKKEWFAKISIVVEEIDESNFWLGFIKDLSITSDSDKLILLIKESEELVKIFAKARATSIQRNNNNLGEPLVPYQLIYEEE